MKIGRVNIPKAYILLIGVSIFSKVLGFFREVVIAKEFGVSAELDLFLLALTIPNLFFGVLLYAVPNYIISQFSKENVKGDRHCYNSFSSRFFWPYILTLFILSALYFVLCPYVMKIMAGQLDEESLQTAIKLSKWFTIYMFLTGSFCAYKGLYHLKKWFLLPAVAPFVIHVFVILSVLLFGSTLGSGSIVFGMIVGSFFQLVILIADAKHKGIYRHFVMHNISGLSGLKLSVVVIIIIELLGQTYTVIDRFYTDQLPVGYISGLSYATLLNMLPISILGLTLGAVLLPDFSGYVSNEDFRSLKKAFFNGIIMVTITGVICAIVLFFGAEFIVKIILKRGAFGEEASFLTKQFLKYLSLGIPIVMFHAIISKLYLALNKAKWLLFFTLIAIFVKAVSIHLFIGLEWYWGVALSTVIAFAVNDILLISFMIKDGLISPKKSAQFE